MRDTEQDQGRVERQRGERVGGDPDRLVVVDGGDDRHPGRKMPEDGAEPRVVGYEDGLVWRRLDRLGPAPAPPRLPPLAGGTTGASRPKRRTPPGPPPPPET